MRQLGPYSRTEAAIRGEQEADKPEDDQETSEDVLEGLRGGHKTPEDSRRWQQGLDRA